MLIVVISESMENGEKAQNEFSDTDDGEDDGDSDGGEYVDDDFELEDIEDLEAPDFLEGEDYDTIS